MRNLLVCLRWTFKYPIVWGVLFLACGAALWADTCSYTYRCTQNGCAAVMGEWSGTRSSSGVTFDQCEAARKNAIPYGSSTCTCAPDGSAPASNPNGSTPMAQGHNLQENMVSYGANMMVANIQNSTTRAFMNSFTNTFLQTMFDNQQQAEQQRQILEQQLAEKRRREEEQRRIAEQQRLDAMFARLNRELKLEGVPFGLTLKPMSSNTDLQLKGMNSGGPEDLKLKLGQEDSTPTSYGIKGLPGIYVGGPAGSNPASDPATQNPNLVSGPGTGQTGSGISGLPGIYVGGPAGSDPATSASESPAQNPNLVSGPGTGQTGPGIPGLPGIYIDRVQPQEAPEVAQAATHLTGTDKTLAQDVALQAAEKNPVLTGQTSDPNVRNFQQTNQQYEQDKLATQTAQQQWTEAQSRADSDKAALELARSKVDSGTATSEQQQAYRQMVELTKTDEDAAQKGREIFDGASAKLSASRTNAASALASLVPATGTSSGSLVTGVSGSQPNSISSDVVDLSHTKTTAPMSLKLGTNNGVPIPAEPVRATIPAPKTTVTPVMDTSVVDARNVPSGLPKSVESAIAAAYGNAQPMVIDRVQKGFQAVANNDWSVAKAWFADALNHDPGNVSLQRLVTLCDYTQKRTAPGSHVQLPQDSDMQFLFPGPESGQRNQASNIAGTTRQVPNDPDLELLFPNLPQVEAKELNDYMFDQAIRATENDPVLVRLSQGKNGSTQRQNQ